LGVSFDAGLDAARCKDFPDADKETHMRFVAGILLIALFVCSGGFWLRSYAQRQAPATAARPALAHNKPFPDFGYLPPPGQYSGPVFKLSQDFPATKPTGPLPAFFKTDFKKNWMQYLEQVRDYCFEGNIDNDWRVEKNPVRKWYHMPWQHWGLTGREGIHGLTKEAPVQPQQLAIQQTYEGGQTYAVGFYNDLGGYAIGQVWRDHMNPDPGFTSIPGGGFPQGTVVCKTLFVDVPIEQVPFLINPIQWQAFITENYDSDVRSVRTVSLIQMDIMVKDKRAPSGWIFGTFQYNGALNNNNRWKNLIPVGIMWGNDPENNEDTYTNPTPQVTKINSSLRETRINDTSELPPTHLGWNGRLNGPVDNPRSSCMSCHMTAEYPALSPLSPLFLPTTPPQPVIGSKAWMRWFQNVPCGKPFDAAALSCDSSLQMADGIANFHQWHDDQDGDYAKDYEPQPAALGARGMRSAPAKPKVFQIIRDVRPKDIPQTKQ
jgi:hypothetical protein